VRCTSDCVCDDCHNDGRHEEKRIEAIRRIRMNNASAFKGTALEIENQAVLTPRGSTKMIRGCRCKRSQCQKKYCECYSAGIKCTTNCVCKDCANGNDGGSIKEVAAITKGHAVGRSPRAPGSAKGHSARQGAQMQRQKLQPSLKHQPGLQQASQRPPSGAGFAPPLPAGGGAGKATSGSDTKKSFRRNDLKVGVPVPTYTPGTYIPPMAGDGHGTAQLSAQPIVTPHGSIHLPGKTRSSPRGLTVGTPGLFPGSALGAYPGSALPGSALWNSQLSAGPWPSGLPSASFWNNQPSAGTRSSPRWSQNSPAIMREESSFGEGGSGMLRSDSLLVEQYSPMSGDLKSPATRALARSAREGERVSPRGGLVASPRGGGASAGPSASQRRTSSRSNGSAWPPLSATGTSAAPFGDSTLALSPVVTEGSWGGLVDPGMDPDGILPSWGK
jgi:hypothetical protein